MAGISVKVYDNFTAELAKKLPTAGTRAEHWLAIEVMKDTDPFVPAQTRSLANRAQYDYDPLSERREVVKNRIIYPGPYARYLYYGKVMVDRETGLPAFRIVGKDGSEVFRFRKGAKLKPTDKPLKISKAVNPQATDHWIEASKNQNLKKWMEVGEELIVRGLNTR